jgi:hypothetical protein
MSSRSDRERSSRSRAPPKEPTIFESLYNSLPTYEQVSAAAVYTGETVSKGATEGYSMASKWYAGEPEKPSSSRSSRSGSSKKVVSKGSGVVPSRGESVGRR